jgi:O-antigen biosynthesis protein
MERLPYRRHDHGRVSPEQLNRIYNQCFAGLSLSLTNVSLVPHEMLAAGCIPVVNDVEQNRMVLDNPFMRYAEAYPQGLVNELSSVVRQPDFATLSEAATLSVLGTSWADAGATVDAIFRRAFAVDLARRSDMACR